MTKILKPDNAEQVLDAVKWAVSEATPLEIRGRGTKDGFGRPVQAGRVLDLSNLSGISFYDPGELVMTVGPATPMAEIEQALADANQELQFEPMDLGVLYGNASGAGATGSIGGVIAANLSGPRRVKSGAARDHFLGFQAVSGRGDVFKSGGRVMKNVTGYDLSKVLCGSYGTLAAMTAMTVKVLPAPEKTRTVLVYGLDPVQAVAALADGLNGPFEVSGAAWIPHSIADRSDTDHIRQAGGSVTALRIEGFGPSVEYRCAKLRDLLSTRGETEELHSHNSASFWKAIRDVEPFRGDDRVVWKISVAPTDAPAILSALAHLKAVEAYLDWAGGLIWLAVDAPRQGAHEPVRDAVNAVGGHATLIRAGDALRGTIPVFHPQPAALAAITKRLKDSFDPNGVLNPGRMSEGV